MFSPIDVLMIGVVFWMANDHFKTMRKLERQQSTLSESDKVIANCLLTIQQAERFVPKGEMVVSAIREITCKGERYRVTVEKIND